MLKERTTDQLCTWVYPVTSRPTLAPTPEPTQAAEGYSECYMDEDFGKADKGCVIDPKIFPQWELLGSAGGTAHVISASKTNVGRKGSGTK